MVANTNLDATLPAPLGLPGDGSTIWTGMPVRGEDGPLDLSRRMTASVGGALNPIRRGVHSFIGRRSSSCPIGPLSPEHDAPADVLHVGRQLVGSAAAAPG